MRNARLVLPLENLSSRALLKAMLVVSFVFLIALGAYLRFYLWFTPVPFTMQTFFVVLGPALIGSYPAAISAAIYLILGVLGFPLFSGAGSGLNYLLGPTSGYMIGFIVSSIFIGRFLNYRQSNRLKSFFVFYGGALIILFSGAVWLKFAANISFNKALILGVVPFLVPDLLKSLLAWKIYFLVSKKSFKNGL